MQRTSNIRKNARSTTGFSTGPKMAFFGCVLASMTIASSSLADKAALMPILPKIPYDPKFDAFLHKESGQIGSEPIERIIVVDPYVDDYITFYLGYLEQAPKIEIKNPDGDVIDQNEANVHVRQHDRLIGYRIQNPAVGNWKVVIQQLDDRVSKPYVFAVTGQGEHNLYFHVNSQFLPDAERDAQLKVVVGGPHTVKGIQISGVVIDPKGNESEIELLDDGRNESGDEHAGDGRYATILTNLAMPGTYQVRLIADGRNGMTVVPGDSPDFVGSPAEPDPVPHFMRYSWTEILVKEQ